MARKVPIKLIDAGWLMVDSQDTPTHIGALAIFTLPPDASEHFLRELVAELRLQREFAPPFNLKLAAPLFRGVLGSWIEDDAIDIDYHLRHLALPAPGGERELGMLISRLHSRPLDKTRPLWECHLIEGLEHNRFAVYMKVHHSQIDGIAAVRVMQKVMTTDPNARELRAPWTVGRGRKIKPRSSVALPRQLWNFARDQVVAIPGFVKGASQLLGEPWTWKRDPANALPYSAPVSILNAAISSQRRFATQYYEFERIRRVATAAEATVNDVFLNLCAGALRRYLEDLNQLPEAPLTAGVPVAVRPADADEVTGNAISFIIANLNTHIADPLTRLLAVKQSTTLAKEKVQTLSSGAINRYTMTFMMPFFLQILTGLAGYTRSIFNVTISNVPGPAEPLYFNGARMEQMYPISLLTDGQALNITVVSYAGQFNVGITGCRDTLPHMQHIAPYMAEELESIERALNLDRNEPQPAVST